MSANEVRKNYTLGRGKLNFGQFRPGTQNPRGERYLGNSPELSFSATQETLDHYYSDGGVRVKDATVILQQDYAGAFTLDDINMANLAMFFLGETSVLTQASRTVTGELHSGVEAGFSYQLGTSNTEPTGVRKVSTVVIKDAAVPATIYAPGVDYVVDEELARFTVLEGGALAASPTPNVSVDYMVEEATRDRVISKGTTIEGTLRYIAANPAGANIDYFMPYVKITPNGDLNLKGDDWQNVPLTLEILKKGDLEAIYADGRPYTA